VRFPHLKIPPEWQVLLESDHPFERVRDAMDCCDRSEGAKSLAAELKTILEWDGAGLRPDVVSERHELEGRVARKVRGRDIVLELIALRQACEAQHTQDGPAVAPCGVKEFFGEKVCCRSLLADSWRRSLEEKKSPASEEGERGSISRLGVSAWGSPVCVVCCCLAFSSFFRAFLIAAIILPIS